MFSCFSKKIENNENNDVRPIYNNIIDSVFTLNKRIENEGYEPNDFDKAYLEQNVEFLDVDKFDINYRNILFNKICILLDFDSEMKDIINNIDDMRFNISNMLYSNMLPVFFQSTNNLDKKDKLKDIIYNKIHLDNIKKLNKLI